MSSEVTEPLVAGRGRRIWTYPFAQSQSLQLEKYIPERSYCSWAGPETMNVSIRTAKKLAVATVRSCEFQLLIQASCYPSGFVFCVVLLPSFCSSFLRPSVAMADLLAFYESEVSVRFHCGTAYSLTLFQTSFLSLFVSLPGFSQLFQNMYL